MDLRVLFLELLGICIGSLDASVPEIEVSNEVWVSRFWNLGLFGSMGLALFDYLDLLSLALTGFGLFR